MKVVRTVVRTVGERGPNFEPEHPLARSDILHCLNVYYGRIAAGGAPRHRTGGIASYIL